MNLVYSPAEITTTHQPEATAASTDGCALTEIAIDVLKALGLIFMAAGSGCIVAGLQVPAIALFVVGAIALIFGFALHKSEPNFIRLSHLDTISPLEISEEIKDVRAPKTLELGEEIKDVCIPALAFGKKEWQMDIKGDVGEVPPLPENIYEILREQCPFWPDKSVGQTHMLVLIPKTVTQIVNRKSVTVPLTLKTLDQLVKSSSNGNEGYHDRIWAPVLRDYGDIEIEKSYWVLMTTDILPETENTRYLLPDFDSLKERVEKKGYQIPSCLEACTCILLERKRTLRHLFGENPQTLIRCPEVIDAHRVAVGDFSYMGLKITTEQFYIDDDVETKKIGVAGLRRL